MVQSAAEVSQEYKLSLDELASNNKMQINLLTILAEDYKNFPDTIVDTIEKQLYTVPKERKLPILYVIDSILKNISSTEDYKTCFEKIIIKIFLHVFVHSDEKQRSSLYKLRTTWNAIFKLGTLYKLDMSVNSEDSNWPIQNPKTGASASGSASSGSTSSPQVHINPKFLANQQGNTGRDPRSGASANARPPTKTSTNPADPRQQIKPAQVKAEIKGQEKQMSVFSPAYRDIVLGPTKKEIKEEPEDPSVQKKISPPKRKTDDIQKPERKRIREEKIKDEDLRTNKSAKSKRQSRFSPANPTNPPPFANSIPPPTVVAPATGTVVPGPMFNPSVNLSPSINDFSPSHHMTHIPPPGVFVPPAQAQQYYPPMEPVSKAVIHHETGPKLELPANNRIFVDGRAHEVFYIGETAVIERNGLPHRIYFSGTPRNVIIDGIAYSLSFGERKTVYIDGQPHILRFGSPSKELYMGTYAFKGQFGGAPIIAIIDNMRHEIRLSGPPPEVKIEPDPAYELSKDMHNIRSGTIHANEKPGGGMIWKNQQQWCLESALDLLRRLQKSGLLLPKKEEKPKDVKIHHKKSMFSAKETTPPRPSEHTFDSVERKLAPGTTLSGFNMRLLKIRYSAIVEALHEKQQNACPQCGMRMELSGERYKNHLDWHVKRNLQTLDRTSTSRPWFSAGKDWLASEDESIAGPSSINEESEEMNGSAPAVNSDAATNKECMVCGERFEEYFDEDEDMWRLRNTVMIQDKVCHVGCVQDASLLETSVVDHNEVSFISDPSIVVEHKSLNLVTQAQ